MRSLFLGQAELNAPPSDGLSKPPPLPIESRGRHGPRVPRQEFWRHASYGVRGANSPAWGLPAAGTLRRRPRGYHVRY